MDTLRKYFACHTLSRLIYTNANTIHIVEEKDAMYLILFTRSLHITVIKYQPDHKTKRMSREEVELVTANKIDHITFTVIETTSRDEVLDELETLIQPDHNIIVPIHNLDGYEILTWNMQSWVNLKYNWPRDDGRIVSIPEWRIRCYHISQDNEFVSGIVAFFSMVSESVEVVYYGTQQYFNCYYDNTPDDVFKMIYASMVDHNLCIPESILDMVIVILLETIDVRR